MRTATAWIATALVALTIGVGSPGVATGPPAADVTIRPGPGQVAVTGAAPGDRWLLRPPFGHPRHAVADDLGSILWRDLPPGDYIVRHDGDETPVEVPGFDEPPAASFYEGQALPAGGFGYLTVRDGTTLSVNVVLPGPPEAGPYPTVVEYSGYAPSDPNAGPGLPALYGALGYAYVGVNMRGSGCSGGSFDYFEDIQRTDGYDVIETVAAQPWVLGHRVGMVGISYSGISQLYVASTQPPSLAAITPLSVLDDATRFTLSPGGILNTGFALEWSRQRDAETVPYGQPWTRQRADEGDATCAANQSLRLQNPGLERQIDEHPFYVDDIGRRLAPTTFVDRITVPVFLAGSWQDEQTGGHFATMLDRFTGTDRFFASLTNGLHTEAISPWIAQRYAEFLELYVAQRTPNTDALQGLVGPLGSFIFGTDQLTLAPNRFDPTTPYDEARARFEGEPRVQIGLEEGGVPGHDRWPEPVTVIGADRWPMPDSVATTWYLGPGGALTPSAPGPGGGTTSYIADPAATPASYFDEASGNIWSVDVTYDWRPNPAGTAAVFTSDPFPEDLLLTGSGVANVWISADAPDADLEVTLTEVRADGTEVLVQSGWQRASLRAQDRSSTPLSPVFSGRQIDRRPLVPGEMVEVPVAIYPFAHPFRTGSRLRLSIDAPGGNRQIWAFDTLSHGETVTVAHDEGHPSSVTLGAVAGVVSGPLPACNALRGQPCRPDPYPNG